MIIIISNKCINLQHRINEFDFYRQKNRIQKQIMPGLQSGKQRDEKSQ